MKLTNAMKILLTLLALVFTTACRDDKLTSTETVEGPQGTLGRRV